MFEIACSILFALFVLAILSPLFFSGVNESRRQLRRNTFLLVIYLLFDSLFDLDYSLADFLRFLLWLTIGSLSGLLFYKAVF